MANSTRSSCKTIEENSRGRQSGGGGSDISLSTESSGLRRSTRDTKCKKKTTPKKLGQANKQVANSPATWSLAKKVTTSSPLRRSKRCNKQSSSLKSSESTAEISSTSPELNNKKRKVERKEKTPKQSKFGTVNATENVDREYDSGQAKRIRTTRRAYKSLLRKQEEQVKVSGKYEELASLSKSPAKDGSNSGGCMSKERAAAVESGQVIATESSPRKETAENLHEKESTQINQINSAGQVGIQDTANVDECVNEKIHSLPLLSVTELREMDISKVAELPEVADSSTKEKGNDVDAYEERVVKGRADATAIAVCKDNSSVASPPSHQENHVGEATTVNMSRKSGKLEDGVDIRLDKHSVQISVQKLAIQGNDEEQLPGCKADSSKFMEYWVPAQLSHLQLEKYCSVLLSSSLTLRSSLKSDIFGALGDILADIRECCDHPYLLDKDKDNSLDNFLKSLELTQLLDIGIQASGKLDLLVKFLVEMRTRGMRTLILFQSISNFGKDPKSSGDILDDLMRQKFGVDSYERVDAGLVRAKVQTALNNFNDKELGRFAFLLEGRACRPSIKLSSVDVVIVFTSDLNPANDIRNLQKLTMDSESEKLKVLRLYSCFTVEEKVLINAKQRIGMDGRLDEINSLLRWGASYIFDRLKEFHCNTDESSKLIISDPLHADGVVKELISLLSVVEDKNISNSSMIVRVQQNEGVYSTECPLVGESKNHLSMEKLPHIFWAELLEGKYPPWRYLSNSGQRNRKRLQNSGGLHVEQGDNIDQAGNKRIKLANDNGLQSSTKRGNGEGKTAIEAARSYPPPPENGASNSMAECDESRKRLNAQRSLLCVLQPDVSRLCEVLNLTDDVKQKADIFLIYVVNNYQVDREPKSILQAFLLALCWTAASLLEVKVNHNESFELAKVHLSYSCEWNQAEYVYKMMLCLKEMFLNKTQSLEAEDYRTPSSNTSQLAVFSPVNRQVNHEDIPLVQDNPSKSDGYDLNKLAERNIQKIKNNPLKLMRELLLLNKEERNQICSTFEEAKANLDKEHRIEAAVVRSLHGEGPTRTDKLNALESEYNRKVENHKNQMLASLSDLDRTRIDDRTKLQLKEASLIEELSEWFQTKLLKKPAESADGGESCFSDSDGPDIIKLNGARASAIAPEESLSEARAPEVAPSQAGAHEEASNAAKAPDAVGASKEAPHEVRAPEETPVAANDPEEAPVATDIGSIDLQAVQDLIGDTSGNHIVGDVPSRLNNFSLCRDRPISEVNVGVSDATSADEQDISGNPNQQEPRSDRRGKSTLPQIVDITPRDDSVLQSLPEERQNQCNAGSTSSTTHKGNGSSVERLNAPAQVSTPMVSSTANDGQAQPDQPDSNVAQTDNIPDFSPVTRTAQPPSTNGCTSLNFPELRQVSELLEASRPLAHAVQCTVNTQATCVPINTIASGSGTGSMQPSFCMPSGRSDPLPIELDKIHKQMDHSIKNLEETKKQLEVECQKEIAKIRQKFAVKVQESEAEYVSEKNELETNLQKVVKSKIFAAAIRRYNCMDPKKAGTPATTISPPDTTRSSSQPWITSAAPVHRFSSLTIMNHTSAAGATSNSQSSTQPWAPPLVQTLYRSPLLPSSHIPLVSQGQREVVIRSPAPHLQSASRPLSHGVAPRSIPPPPGYHYHPQSSSAPVAQFPPKPRAVAQTGPFSSVANRMDQVGSRIPQPPNIHDRRFIANLLNATTPSFSEVRPSGGKI